MANRTVLEQRTMQHSFCDMAALPALCSALHVGIDEAGRGCLAGPVCAAAVIFPLGYSFAQLPELDDSKRLTAVKREALAPLIQKEALAFGLGYAWPREIERINILQASFRAMIRAVSVIARQINLPPLIIDGNFCIPLTQWQTTRHCIPLTALPQQVALIKGDARLASIAAASVLAKTTRDRLMCLLDTRYPQYGFAQHKGYGTKAHLAALEKFGASVFHRVSFRGVPPSCVTDAPSLHEQRLLFCAVP